MAKQEYEFHPLASVLPMLGQVETDELAADIQANGLRSDIILLDGKILDGRNRYKACKIVNVEPRFRDFNGEGDPIDFIVSVNVKRRHLTASQKALVVAKVAQLPRGDVSRIKKSSKTPIVSQTAQSADRKTVQSNGTSAERAAQSVGVSSRTVEQAKQVLREAPKEEIKAVERGEKSVATVVKEIKKAKEAKPTEKRKDATDYPIPEGVLVDWDRADELARKWLRAVSDLRSEIEAVFKDESILLVEIDNTTLADLNNAYSSIKLVKPHAVCGSCQGVQRKKCDLCKRRGFLSAFAWKNYVPEETKTMREKIR